MTYEGKVNRSLTAEEICVLAGLAEGARRWELTRRLDCSERTIEQHLASIWRKWLALNGLRQSVRRDEVSA